MAANNIDKKRRARSPPYLLMGLIFDSAGNRMSPTHTIKKGVRYRYYVSQALVQCRKEEAGTVARVSAPDVEAIVSSLIATRFCTLGVAPTRQLLEAHIHEIVVQAEAVEVTLKAEDRGLKPFQSPETVSLSRTRQPLPTAKGVVGGRSSRSAADSKARNTALAAIGKARQWLGDILAGGSFAEIAKREGKCERQIRLLFPLAFTPPVVVRQLIDGPAVPMRITEMAKSVPMVWA